MSFIQHYKHPFLFLLFFFSSLSSFSQNTTLFTYGTANAESASSLLSLNDGTYIIGAKNSTPDFLLLHINADGSIIKQAIIPSTHNISKLIKLSNGDYLITGSESSAEQASTILIRMNSSFVVLWSKKLTATNMAYSFSAIECSNGDITVVGYSSISGTSNGNWDCLIYRVNALGTLLWKKIIVTSSNSDWLVDLVELPGGNIVAVGATSNPNVNYLMLKISPSGDVLTKIQFEAGANEVMYSPVLHNNKLYITAGTWSFNIGQYDIALLRLDTNFVLESSSVYGSTGIDFPMHSIIKDNVISVVAYSNSFDPNYDLLLVRLNLNGDILQSKRIGSSGRELLFTKGDLFVINNDQSYSITGETNSFGKGQTDIFFSTFQPTINCCNFIHDISLTKNSSVYTEITSFTISTDQVMNTFSDISRTTNAIVTFSPEDDCVNNLFNVKINADTLVCITENVRFSTNTNASNPTFTWNFGDPVSGVNNVSNAAIPSHSFSSPGLYEVIVKINNGCVDVFDTLTVRVTNKLKTNTTIANMNLQYCKNSPVNFNALNNEPGVSYTWNFGDLNSGGLNSSNLVNPSHLFTDTGTYVITLISNLFCKSDTDTILIRIIEGESLTADINAIKTINCTNTLVNFSHTTNANGALYYWIFDDPSSGANNTSSLANPTHIYQQPGVYIVFAIVKNLCHSDTDTIHLTINKQDTIQTTPNSLPPNLCVNDSINFSYTSNETTIQSIWNFGDGDTDSTHLNSIKHKFNSAGIYTVILISKSICHSDTDTILVTVMEKARANIIVSSNTFCRNELVSFNASITGSHTNLSWNFNDPSSGSNNTSSDQNTTHNFNSLGSYTVRLITNSICGIDTDFVDIFIIDKVELNTSVNPFPRIYCIGDTVKIVAKSDDGNAVFSWDFGDPNSGSQNFGTGESIYHVFNTMGTYTITLASSNRCNNKIDTLVINITPPTSPDFHIDIDSCLKIFNFENSTVSSGSNNYVWLLNDSIISTDFHASSFIKYEGVHKISLVINPNTACEDSTVKIISFTAPSNNGNLTIPNTFTPNNDGINDVFAVKGGNSCAIKKMIIFNRWGKKLFETENGFFWDGKIDGTESPVGTYILYLEIGENTIVRTITLIR